MGLKSAKEKIFNYLYIEGTLVAKVTQYKVKDNRLQYIWNIFYSDSLSSIDSRRAVVSFWWKNVHNTG